VVHEKDADHDSLFIQKHLVKQVTSETLKKSFLIPLIQMLKRAFVSFFTLNSKFKMAAPLTHPCIVDGWFMEKSTMWPGQGKAVCQVA
jgi:hypothetical protein